MERCGEYAFGRFKDKTTVCCEYLLGKYVGMIDGGSYICGAAMP
jgi:hypothetical protein